MLYVVLPPWLPGASVLTVIGTVFVTWAVEQLNDAFKRHFDKGIGDAARWLTNRLKKPRRAGFHESARRK
jgi:hypothetical protein